jgi:oxygen-dependent protoporphyrinogen oxidase
VVGGGISGLATAHFLRSHDDGRTAPAVTLIEATDRLGGKILTREFAGHSVDVGPDSVLARPAIRALFERLGLAQAVVPAAPLGSYIWSRKKLRRIPAGTLVGVPDRVLPLVRSGLLSASGTLRAGVDLVRPRCEQPDDATITELLKPRFGEELLDRLVAPLVGGIHAGDADALSARSTVPDVDALVRSNRSVLLAMQRRRRSVARAAKAGHVFDVPRLVTLDGGLRRLVDALAGSLEREDVLLGSSVESLERTASGFRLKAVGDGTSKEIEADAVVLATSAPVTADIVGGLAPEAANALRAVTYADVATVTLSYPRTAIAHALDATGFLVPRCEGRFLVGCTWLTSKWPNLAADSGVVIIRGLVGRAGDHRWMELDDAALVRQVHAELDEAIGLSSGPQLAHVQRWPHALPQYTVGHQRRLERIDNALAEIPGLYVTGAAYRGVGVAGCVAQAAQTADQLLQRADDAFTTAT